VGLLVVVVLLAVACHPSDNFTTSTGQLVHWQQNVPNSLERRITLVVPATLASDGSFMRGINSGMLQANRSPYVATVLHVPNGSQATCPTAPGTHCVRVFRAPMNGAVAYVGWSSTGHMFGAAARLGFDSAPWTAAVLANAVCHELFHALGLKHSSHGTPGPCQGGIATDWDLALVRNAHNHPDPLYTGTITTATSSGRRLTLRLVDHSTRAELALMAALPAG